MKIKMNGSLTRLGLTALTLTLLGACGGGGGSSSGSAPVAAAPNPPPATTGGSNNPPPAGVTPEDVIRGTITGFGSVFINGKRFATDDALFLKDDSPSSQDQLAVGMVVTVTGDAGSGVASRVQFDEDIKGPVDAVGQNELTVLGQRVLITPETRFDSGLSMASIQTGDLLEISGFRTATDDLEAAFIEGKNAGEVEAYEVTGNIRDLDTSASTFRIGGLTVNYAAARIDDLPGGLAEGRLVEVEDTAKAYSPGDFQLIATKVDGERPLRDDDDTSDDSGSGADNDNNGSSSAGSTGGFVQVEALIAEVVGDSEFILAGIRIRHDAGTRFVFGDATLLAAGTKVEVEGRFNDDDSIQASRIKFSRNAARIDGIVDGVDLNAAELVVFGVRVTTSGSTDFEDKRDDVTPFGLADILPGDFIELRGSATGTVIRASEIERDDEDDTELRGAATHVDAGAGTLTILGVNIVTDSSTQYEGFDDEVLTRGQFFERVVEGQTLVEAKWRGAVTDASVAVRELDLED